MINKLIMSIDTHTEGEPTRIIISRIGKLPGSSIYEKNKYFKENYDNIRKSLMLEPRGHRDMFGCLLIDAIKPTSDYGAIFMDNEGYMNMCGHATIGLCTVLAEMGMVKITEPITKIKIETAGGEIDVSVKIENGRAQSVSFTNVASFVEYLNEDLYIENIGKIKVDIAYGGNYFVFFRADDIGLNIDGKNMEKLIDIGLRIRKAANEKLPVKHPLNEKLNEIYVSTIWGPPTNSVAKYKNVHLFSRQFGRSPGGTGTSAMMAILHEKGDLKINEEIVAESITGGLFKGKLVEEIKIGNKKAFIPLITGSAKITGFHNFVFDDNDHLRNGFLLY